MKRQSKHNRSSSKVKALLLCEEEFLIVRFFKYEGLGNDYLVWVAQECPPPEAIRTLCSRHYGVGADGLLWQESSPTITAAPSLRIFNPDGSEAEKSGNGLRIFARYLWEQKKVGEEPFQVHTQGGTVQCQVLEQGQRVRVAMGQAQIVPRAESSWPTLSYEGRTYSYIPVSIGNPHAVFWVDEPSAELAQSFGPFVEKHPHFPEGTNVQLASVSGPQSLRLEIWERGAGYTRASGSSSCAAVAAALTLGYCDTGLVDVQMPGGILQITIDSQLNVTLEGPVRHIAVGVVSEECLATHS